MRVKKILSLKDTDVLSVQPDTSMQSFGKMVVEKSIGAAPVTDSNGALVGIISERDIVRGFHTHGATLHKMTVGEAMTKKVVSCGPENSVADVINLMNEHKIRHIAVLDSDELCGFISIRDVAFNRVSQLELDNETLRLLLENYDTMG